MKSRTPQCSGFYEKLNALRAEVFSVEEPRLFFPLTDNSIVSLKLRAVLSALASSLLLA